MSIRNYISIVEGRVQPEPVEKVNEMGRRRKPKPKATPVKPSVVYPFDDPAGEALIGKYFGFFTDADFDETDESLIGWYYRKQAAAPFTHKYWEGPFLTSAAAREAQQADPSAIW